MFGYRPSQVDDFLAAQGAMLVELGTLLEQKDEEFERAQRRVLELDAVCDQLSDRVIARERELAHVRHELDRLREEGEEGMRMLSTLAEELEAVRRQARGQATRIRMNALREAVELSGRITEMTRRPAEARERLLASLQDAIERIGAEDERTGAEEPAPALRSVGDVFEGVVEIDVGPLADFSQLVGFEDAAAAIPAISEISVKRFARGRATIEVKLADRVELLRELEQRAPFGFAVSDLQPHRIVLDVAAAEAQAA